LRLGHRILVTTLPVSSHNLGGNLSCYHLGFRPLHRRKISLVDPAARTRNPQRQLSQSCFRPQSRHKTKGVRPQSWVPARPFKSIFQPAIDGAAPHLNFGRSTTGPRINARRVEPNIRTHILLSCLREGAVLFVFSSRLWVRAIVARTATAEPFVVTLAVTVMIRFCACSLSSTVSRRHGTHHGSIHNTVNIE
jgi:hypothetical protein